MRNICVNRDRRIKIVRQIAKRFDAKPMGQSNNVEPLTLRDIGWVKHRISSSRCDRGHIALNQRDFALHRDLPPDEHLQADREIAIRIHTQINCESFDFEMICSGRFYRIKHPTSHLRCNRGQELVDQHAAWAHLSLRLRRRPKRDFDAGDKAIKRRLGERTGDLDDIGIRLDIEIMGHRLEPDQIVILRERFI